jgi:hypothetical protein
VGSRERDCPARLLVGVEEPRREFERRFTCGAPRSAKSSEFDP